MENEQDSPPINPHNFDELIFIPIENAIFWIMELVLPEVLPGSTVLDI